MLQKLLKTGEFAQICQTTKDTLFHYDSISLLKPAQVQSNGYRFYTLSQMYMFDLITTLKEAGLSLTEIQHYIHSRNTPAFVALLQEKDKVLKKEIDMLAKRRRLLRNTMRLAEVSLAVEENRITYQRKEVLYFIRSDEISSVYDKNAFATWGKHYEYCFKHNYCTDFSTGEMVPEAHIADCSFRASCFLSQVPHLVRSKRLHIRPAGIYAVKYVRCSYHNLPLEYAKFYSQLQQYGLHTMGSLYQNDITNYLSEQNAEDYLSLIEIRLQEGQKLPEEASPSDI